MSTPLAPAPDGTASGGKPTRQAALGRAIVLLVVGLLSVGVLLFVGHGEALRTYGRFQLERLQTQAEVVRTAMEPLLNAGLPLAQFGGFENLAKRVIEADASLVAVAVFDPDGAPVYAAGAAKVKLLPPVRGHTATPAAIELRRGEGYRQASARLATRFGDLGFVAVTMPETSISGPVKARFAPLLWIGGIASVVFAIAAALLWRRGGRAGALAAPVGFTVLFVAMSAAVGGSLVRLYESGATAKTQVLAASLAQRLQPFVAMGLRIDDFSGLGATFANYRKLNPDLSALALVIDGRVAIDTETGSVGKPWRAPNRAYVYESAIGPAGTPVRLAVAIPDDVVWSQVLRSAKDFAALFIAAILLALLMLGLADTLGRRAGAARSYQALGLLRPAFLVAVLAENLIVSFLPQRLASASSAFASPDTATSILFMAYFLCFALSLVPAGRMADRRGPRPMIVAGAVLAAIGFVPLILTNDFLPIAMARAVAGVGQGMLLAGTQAYILRAADPAARTQGTSIIVYGFNAGMIAGAALGSLMATFVGEARVIALGACLTTVVALYAAIFIPREGEGVLPAAQRNVFRDIGRVIGDLQFLRTLLLIGAPAKAVLTGVVVFALPLLLARKGYPPQDIGQIVMLYALGVLLVTGRASRMVDRLGSSDMALFGGAALSGLSLIAIGLITWKPDIGLPAIEPWLIAVSVFLLGIAHGLINAPVVTNVADIPLARQIGAGTVTATYRFLERIGHVAGPLIVAQIWGIGASGGPLLAIGIALGVLGLCFIAFRGRRDAVSPA